MKNIVGPKIFLLSEKNVNRNIGPKTILGLKKNFRSEKISGPKKFEFKNDFRSNKNSGLKILGPNKILANNSVFKNKFGSEEVLSKNILVQ